MNELPLLSKIISRTVGSLVVLLPCYWRTNVAAMAQCGLYEKPNANAKKARLTRCLDLV